MREILLPDMCPGCYLEKTIDNPLRSQPGGVIGIYCIKPDSPTNEKGHIYPDTEEMRGEMLKATKAKREVKAQVKVSDTKGPEKPEEEVKEPAVALLEPKMFEVTEMDAARLSDLLGEPIADAGTLVGALYSMKMNATTVSQLEVIREASADGAEAGLRQKGDGSVQLLAFLPWPTARIMVERAIFANVGLQEVLQNQLEFIMAGNSFPFDVKSTGEIDPPYDGFWVALSVPEIYVSVMLDKAQLFGMTPAQYFQAFIMDSIDAEQLV